MEWSKYRKYSYKYLAYQVWKYTNKKCDKYHKKRYIFWFYDSYTSFNKRKTLKESTISSSNFKYNISYITQIVVNKIFKIGITQKIITDWDNIKYLITKCKLIYDYYDNYL